MKILLSLVLLLAVGSAHAEGPKIATVNMEELFRKYHRKIAVEERMKTQLEAIKQNPRVTAVRDLNTKLTGLAEVVKDETNPEDDRKIAAEKFNSTSIEYQSLAKELEQFMTIEQRKVTEQMIDSLELLLEEVREQVNEIGKSENFDLVLEVGGLTSSQTSPIIYLRNGTDITKLVLEQLNHGAPEEAAEEPASEDE